MADVKVLVIDRAAWLRGEGDGDSKLLRQRDGRMCCLGFFGLACGAEREQLLDQGRPDETEARDVEWPDWLIVGRSVTDDCRELMRVNDTAEIAAPARERQVAAIFAKHGVEVRFVDSTEQPRAAPSSPPDPSTEIR